MIMAVDMKALLALPQKERRKIAEKLWESLEPTSNKVQEDPEILELLEKRWNDYEAGKIKMLPPDQFWSKIDAHLHKKKK